MTSAAAVAICVLLTALGVLQVLLACGVPLGRFAWGGGHEVLPTTLRAASVVSVAVYVVIGWVVVARAHEGPGHGFLGPAAWVVAASSSSERWRTARREAAPSAS